jgi:hypothetical protein
MRNRKGQNMIRLGLSNIALTAGLAAALIACNTSDARAPQVSGTPTPEVAVAAPAQHEAPPPAEAPQAATPPEQAHPVDTAEQAPFVLTLRGPSSVPQVGDVQLEALISSPKGFNVPATLSIALPPGARLMSGQENEKLTTIPAGETRRIFKVTLTQKSETPIKVTIDARDPAGAMGAHAERLFPEPAEPVFTRPSRGVPPPPVARPLGHPPTR